MATVATAGHVKKFLGYESSQEFMSQWKVLPDADKTWFTAQVQKLLDEKKWEDI